MVDKATSDAIKLTSSEIKAQASHKRQLARIASRKNANLKTIAAKRSEKLASNTSRKRATIEVINARSTATKEAAQAKQEAASAILQQRERARTERAINPPQRSIRSSIRSRAQSTTIDAGIGKVASTATPSSNSGLIMTTIFVIIGLALFYNVVTKAQVFSVAVGRWGDFFHSLSSTAPLFTAKAK